MSAGVSLDVDISSLLRAEKVFERAGAEAPNAINRALRYTGERVIDKVRPALVAQTGLTEKTIKRAVKYSAGNLKFTLRVKGGNVRVQYFGAKEAGNGVSAHPWNKSRIYAGGFMQQGFGTRHGFTKPGMAGHVFKRKGKGRLPIGQLKSGLYIAKELTRGTPALAFRGTVAHVLPGRLRDELARIFAARGGGGPVTGSLIEDADIGF